MPRSTATRTMGALSHEHIRHPAM
ncbi:hypothetical protein FRIGORI9N_420034 [Frigoribacterium sp. 9N]|nr:hypothetical protein FRIGORI9N_420034 [Frigoribacterium sp. 9N]